MSGKHGTWEIFRDFLEITAISIRNSVNRLDWQKKEDRYLEVIEKYTKPELSILSTMIGELIMAMDKEPYDILGDIYMQLELGDKWKGQFFTPQNISDLMAEITLGNDIDKEIKENGYVLANDSAVGGGSTMIGLARIMKKKKYNYQQELVVICNDIDINSVYMCYIHLSLMGVPAQVIHMDCFKLEPYSYWNTPFFELHGWNNRIGDKHRAVKHLKDKEAPEEKVLNQTSFIWEE